MSKTVFYSDSELPHEFLSRAASEASLRGEIAMADLFNGLASDFAPVPATFGFGVASPAVSWREAKSSQTGRAALELASGYTDILVTSKKDSE